MGFTCDVNRVWDELCRACPFSNDCRPWAYAKAVPACELRACFDDHDADAPHACHDSCAPAELRIYAPAAPHNEAVLLAVVDDGKTTQRTCDDSRVAKMHGNDCKHTPFAEAVEHDARHTPYLADGDNARYKRILAADYRSNMYAPYKPMAQSTRKEQ